MLPDPNALVREVDCHLREVESLVERIVPGVENARKKVEALEWMRRACEAFGESETLTALSQHVEPMRERVRKLELRLRAALHGASLQGASLQGTSLQGTSLQGAGSGSQASAAIHVETAGGETAHPPDNININDAGGAHAEPAANNNTALNNNSAQNNNIHDPILHHLSNGTRPPGIRNSVARPSQPAQVLPPDPADVEKIRELEEECEREFAKLPFGRDDERHAVLTVCAAKARRLRTRLHDSYAVDRRLGDLIRKIVDMKRRYRLGWIDGCERSFDVPDWDAYVDRCEEHSKELKIREQARQEEARVARERATHLQSEVERRGRELRAYLDTEEGRLGAEPEKLRAVLMSYLAVDGGLDGELLEKLRIHKNLFTGIAFRRLRKGFERATAAGGAAEDEVSPEIQKSRDRVIAKMRGLRAVMFAPATSDEVRRRIETVLGLDRMAWVDPSTLDALAWAEFGNQLGRCEIQVVLHATGGPAAPGQELQMRDALKRGAAIYIEVERPEEHDSVMGAVERGLFVI